MMAVKNLLAKFDALGERERLSVFVLLVVTIFVIFAEFIIFPLDEKRAAVDNNVLTVKSTNQQLERQLLILRAESKHQVSPKQKQLQKLKLIEEQIVNLNLRLKENMRGLIEPKEMAGILESVLSKNIGLKLQSIESLPSKPIGPLTATEEGESEGFGIYHHGMRMKLTGSYLSTLKYFEALDKLPWNFYWDDLELNIEKYPNASIDITVHTLSFHKGWIGV